MTFGGRVPICCLDWKHELIIGKFSEDGSLQDIWEGDVFESVRNLILDKKRIMRPCYKCNFNGGFRLGLLKCGVFLEEDISISLLENHYLSCNKYTNKYVKDDPFFYDEKSVGIRSFIQ